MTKKQFAELVTEFMEDSVTTTYQFRYTSGEVVYSLFLGYVVEKDILVTLEFEPFISWRIKGIPVGVSALGAWRREEYDPAYVRYSTWINRDPFVEKSKIIEEYWELHKDRLDSVILGPYTRQESMTIYE